ncbi:MAG: carbohydrate ABC transporter permease [Planctomycetota bacterium]|jgi:multiple sugar transport system permease protein|nr:carbohydrate ABC transporter permease [Planctomycetota bacterium]
MNEIRKTGGGWKIVVWAVVIVALVWTFFPFYWMLSTALKPDLDIYKVPPDLWPKNLTFDNVRKLFWEDSLIPRFFLNSLISSVATVIVTVGLATFSGYALSRLRFRFRQKLLIGILVTQMFPMVVLLIPLYILYLKAHLLNTWVGLVLAFTSFALPFGVWMIKGFIDTVPVEMEEAAMIDGCSRVGALFKVVLPMIVPGVAATAIFAFLDAWNNLLFPLTLVNELEMKTLPPGMILSFMGQFRADWGGMMATSFLTTLPIVILFVLLQRYLVAGLTAGAVKG